MAKFKVIAVDYETISSDTGLMRTISSHASFQKACDVLRATAKKEQKELKIEWHSITMYQVLSPQGGVVRDVYVTIPLNTDATR